MSVFSLGIFNNCESLLMKNWISAKGCLFIRSDNSFIDSQCHHVTQESLCSSCIYGYGFKMLLLTWMKPNKCLSTYRWDTEYCYNQSLAWFSWLFWEIQRSRLAAGEIETSSWQKNQPVFKLIRSFSYEQLNADLKDADWHFTFNELLSYCTAGLFEIIQDLHLEHKASGRDSKAGVCWGHVEFDLGVLGTLISWGGISWTLQFCLSQWALLMGQILVHRYIDQFLVDSYDKELKKKGENKDYNKKRQWFGKVHKTKKQTV